MQCRQDPVELLLVDADDAGQLNHGITAFAEGRRELVAAAGQQVEDLLALVDQGDEGLILLGQRLRQRVGAIEQLAELARLGR